VAIVNALDLLYFWMYQPRARTGLNMILQTMSEEERRILESSQLVLKRNQEVSQMFVDGLVGTKFGKALAFYLDHCEEYLSAFHLVVEKVRYSSAQELRQPALAMEHVCAPTFPRVDKG